jgi:hypothetical protein
VPAIPPKKFAPKAGLSPKRVAPAPTTLAPAPAAAKRSQSPRRASPRKASPPAARKEPHDDEDHSAGLSDSDDGSGSESGEGAVAEETDMQFVRHATSTQDVEDMQSLGILGMMLSQEKRSTISPAIDRKSANW